MTFTDETLMAYADGELGAAERAAIEQAMRADPAVAAAVSRHQALRQDVFAAFAGVLDEPVPATLAQRAGGSKVVQLGAVRESGAARARELWWSWQRLGGMAAMLAVGVLVGSLVAGRRGGTGDFTIASAGGELTASRHLDEALTRQLAGTSGSDVRVGLSFVSKQGSYCRSFTIGATAGLACREGGTWHIPVLAHASGQGGAYRQAASALPQAVLDEVDARIEGTTLDAQAERKARDRGWEAGAR